MQLFLFLFKLETRLVLKPTVSSKTLRELLSTLSSKSGCNLSPVIMDGEQKPGISA